MTWMFGCRPLLGLRAAAHGGLADLLGQLQKEAVMQDYG